MQCESCGETLGPDDRFCGACGTPRTNPTRSNPEPEPQPRPAADPPPTAIPQAEVPQYAPQGAPYFPPPQPKAKSSCGCWLALFFGLAMLVVGLVVGAILLLVWLPNSPLRDGRLFQTEASLEALEEDVFNRLLAEYEFQTGLVLSPTEFGYERMQEQAAAAALNISSGTDYEVNLPFISTDTNGNPIHFQVTLYADDF